MVQNQEGSPQRFKLKHSFSILKEAGKNWNKSDPFRLSAIIAYYAILSMPALLVIIVNLLGLIWGNDVVEGRLSGELTAVMGQNTAEAVTTMIDNAMSTDQSLIFNIIGIASLIFGATGVFFHLQRSLNRIWGLRVNPDASWLRMLIDRTLSFGFVLVLGFLLLITFVLSAALTALSDRLRDVFSDLVVVVAQVADFIITIGVVALLFALIFKFLPHAKVKWKSVWVGAFLTSVLFDLGKYALAFYFGQTEPGSTYGAAGSIILILLWVSYASLIMFFGAQITYVFAKRYGGGVQPTDAAVRENEAVYA